MSVFQFETQLADLQNKYAQDEADQEYGRFLGQQRFARQREDMNRGFTRNFPRFTGQWAGRLGSDVQSGVFKQSLRDTTNDFGRSLDRLDADEAGFMGQFKADQARRAGAYQRALLALNEGLGARRASQDPFAAYTGVYS